MSRARIEQPRVQGRLVGEQQQTLGVRVESAERIHALRKPELRERVVPAVTGAEAGHDAVGLVECDQHAIPARASNAVSRSRRRNSCGRCEPRHLATRSLAQAPTRRRLEEVYPCRAGHLALAVVALTLASLRRRRPRRPGPRRRLRMDARQRSRPGLCDLSLRRGAGGSLCHRREPSSVIEIRPRESRCGQRRGLRLQRRAGSALRRVPPLRLCPGDFDGDGGSEPPTSPAATPASARGPGTGAPPGTSTPMVWSASGLRMLSPGRVRGAVAVLPGDLDGDRTHRDVRLRHRRICFGKPVDACAAADFDTDGVDRACTILSNSACPRLHDCAIASAGSSGPRPAARTSIGAVAERMQRLALRLGELRRDRVEARLEPAGFELEGERTQRAGEEAARFRVSSGRR